MHLAGHGRILAIVKVAGRSTIVLVAVVRIPQTRHRDQTRRAVSILQRRVVGRGLKEYTVAAVCCRLMTETACYWGSLAILLILFRLSHLNYNQIQRT